MSSATDPLLPDERGTESGFDSTTSSFRRLGEVQELLGSLSPHRLAEALEPHLPFKNNKRRRMLCIGGTIVVLICIVVIIMMTAGGKSVAQKSLDDAVIVLDKMHVKDMSSDMMICDNTVSITNKAGYSAWTDPTTVTLATSGNKPYATTLLPHVSMGAKKTDTYLFSDQTVDMTDTSAWEDFSVPLLTAATVDMKWYGKLVAHAPAMFNEAFSLDLHKTLHLTAINNFKKNVISDVVVDSLNFMPTVEAKFHMIGDLFNPSPVEFEDLQSFDADIYYQGSKVGSATSTNTTLPLVMGWNKYSFQAAVVETPKNTVAMKQLVQLMVDGKELPLQLYGRGDKSPFPLLANGLSQMRVDVLVPPIPLPNDDDDDEQ